MGQHSDQTASGLGIEPKQSDYILYFMGGHCCGSFAACEGSDPKAEYQEYLRGQRIMLLPCFVIGTLAILFANLT
jgi:hypothetical protein